MPIHILPAAKASMFFNEFHQLLKLICGIERPSAGKIWFSGHDITRLKNREVPFLRRQIGMIFQDHHLLMDRTVYDNVAIPLIIAGASGDDIRRRVSAALDKVGLLDKAKNFPIQLSGGEQQRVGIARAVVNKPAVRGTAGGRTNW